MTTRPRPSTEAAVPTEPPPERIAPEDPYGPTEPLEPAPGVDPLEPGPEEVPPATPTPGARARAAGRAGSLRARRAAAGAALGLSVRAGQVRATVARRPRPSRARPVSATARGQQGGAQIGRPPGARSAGPRVRSLRDRLNPPHSAVSRFSRRGARWDLQGGSLHDWPLCRDFSPWSGDGIEPSKRRAAHAASRARERPHGRVAADDP